MTFSTISTLLHLFASWFGSPASDNRINIDAEAHDAELIGPVCITRHCQYVGLRQGESGEAIARYDTTYNGGVPRVTKWILCNGGSYLSLKGHHVIYQYFREDGTLEHDRLVKPEAMLGGGVYIKEQLRYFDEHSELIAQHYLRDDGTLGIVSDERQDLFQQFRLDGKTLRFEQRLIDKSRYNSVWYKRDGKTVWMETDVDNRTRVHFDLAGNPVDLNFIRHRVIGSYGMGAQTKPLLTSYDNYTREDGTTSYEQTWYARWDNTVDRSVDTLGAVTIYDETGTIKIGKYTLELRPASQPQFIKQTVHCGTDGTTLVRTYRSPNCRLSEYTVNRQGEVIAREQFPSSDYWQEEIDEIKFQGFTRNIWGTYDDESHDI